MSVINRSLSPEVVTESIESNLIEASFLLGKSEDAVVFRGADVAWVYTGAKPLSRVMRPRFKPDEVEDRVDEISECFRQWDAPVSWIVGPSAWPPQLGEVLHQSGYGNHETLAGMALDLSDWTPDPNLGMNIRVDRVTDPESLLAWAQLGDEFVGDEPAGTSLTPDNEAVDARCRYYLGYRDGKPVSRAMSFIRGETVGLYSIDRLPTVAGSGPDRAVILRAMTDAKLAGATMAVVPATAKLRPTLTELGFATYCQFNVYSWPPTPIKLPIQ